jgi:hypothetical protein
MTSARQRVTDFWDEHIEAWLRGHDPMPEPLPAWFGSYRGIGDGVVARDGLPEPYLGGLLTDPAPRTLLLGLNPGAYVAAFQARNGIFAKEIDQHGSYHAWAASGPYHRSPWTIHHGGNRYHRARLAFTRNWLQDPTADYRDLLIFECFPWHSTKITAPMQPPPEVIDEFVWQPIAELPAAEVFAFGRPWNDVALALRLPVVAKLGLGGTDYGSHVPSRAVRVYALTSGQRLVVEWRAGSAGPPCAAETELLRATLAGHGRLT